jgi:hypothetical protein
MRKPIIKIRLHASAGGFFLVVKGHWSKVIGHWVRKKFASSDSIPMTSDL